MSPTSLENLLYTLQRELIALGLWQYSRPDELALASTQPFCLDTLRFEQWLQFVFIERITLMLQTRQPLPRAIALCPMAEQAFAPLGVQVATLINTIADIDQLLSGERLQTLYRGDDALLNSGKCLHER